MRTQLLTGAFLSGAMAARPFLASPDTGLEMVLSNLTAGDLPKLDTMVGLPDFDYAAELYLPPRNYTYYRNGAAGEYSYRNNMEAFTRYRFKPRVLVDVSNVQSTLPTTMLGHNISAPFFISPCARADYAHASAEYNLVKGAAAGNIIYIPSHFASLSIEEIHAAKAKGQVIFQQLYLTPNDTETKEVIRRSEKAGAHAIVFTVDSAADGNRHRASRFSVGSANSDYAPFTWQYYQKLQNWTSLPVIIKGIGSAADAKLALEYGAPAIVLSNHGGRQLDGSPSAIEIAIDIYRECPEIFKKLEVYADGGVRYGADVLKLLALGVRAVGLGRPFMFANIFGQEGVEKAISLLKHEIAIDAGNLGVADIKKINTDFVQWNYNNWAY